MAEAPSALALAAYGPALATIGELLGGAAPDVLARRLVPPLASAMLTARAELPTTDRVARARALGAAALTLRAAAPPGPPRLHPRRAAALLAEVEADARRADGENAAAVAARRVWSVRRQVATLPLAPSPGARRAAGLAMLASWPGALDELVAAIGAVVTRHAGAAVTPAGSHADALAARLLAAPALVAALGPPAACRDVVDAAPAAGWDGLVQRGWLALAPHVASADIRAALRVRLPPDVDELEPHPRVRAPASAIDALVRALASRAS
jgi:hypothetical protein